MKFSALKLSALATLLASVVNGEGAIADPNSAVVKLLADKFELFIAENPLVLAEFFAPWCGHCKTLGPNFSKAADELSPSGVVLAQIDCTEEEDLCRDQGIRGYPTLKMFRGSVDAVQDYNGGRTADAIVDYMTKQNLPAVQEVEGAEVDEFLVSTLGPVVVAVGLTSKQNGEVFADTASKLRDNYVFVSTDLYGDYPKGTVLVFRADDREEPLVLKASKKLAAEALEEFVAAELLLYFGELTAELYRGYAESGLPMALYFYKTPEEREAAAPLFKRLAKAKVAAVNFLGLDANLYGLHALNLNAEQEFPAFIIHDTKMDLKYVHPQGGEVTLESVEAFVEKYVAGKVEPVIKSEEIPETQEEAVYTLVGKEFDAIVNDDARDVFVEYYAPWCGHCKRLAPVLEELAETYAKSSDEAKVRIAKLDHTANDVPGLQLEGYPTMILYPAGDKKNPIRFEGERTFEGISEFIRDNGKNKVDASKFVDEAVADIIGEENAEAIKEAAKEAAEEAERDEL